MAFSNLRRSSSLPNLLLSSLNLLLFLLSAASFAPLLLLRAPPASFGWALFAVSSATLIASSVGFCSHLTRHRLLFVAQVAFLLASSVGQALGFFSLLLLLLRPEPSLRLLGSARVDDREANALLGIEKGMMAAMFVVGSAVLVLECMVQSWWVREYEEVEAAAAASRKRGRRMARVEVVSEAEIEIEATECIDERMKSKCDQESGKNNIEV